MKKTLTKILSLALTLGLLASLVLAVVPAAAISVPSVSLSSGTISNSPTTATISFIPSLPLIGPTGLATGPRLQGETITITAPGTLQNADTFNGLLNGATQNWTVAPVPVIAGDVVTVTASGTVTVAGGATGTVTDAISVIFPLGGFGLTNVTTADVSFDPGTGAFVPVPIADVTISAVTGLIQFKVPVAAGVASTWRVKIANLINPGAAGTYNLAVSTSKEPVPATSGNISISAPGNIAVYNGSGAYLGTYSSFIPPFTIGDHYTIKLGGGFYVAAPVIAADYVTLTSTGPGVLYGGALTVTGDYFTLSNIIFIGGTKTFTGNFATVTGCTFKKTDDSARGIYPPSSNETLVQVNGTNFTMTGCTVDTSSPAGYVDFGVKIATTAIDATLTDVTFTADQTTAGVGFDKAVDVATGVTGLKVTACKFTGINGGMGILAAANVSGLIMNNTFTGLEVAVDTQGGAVVPTIISSNTIMDSIVNGLAYKGAITIRGAGKVNAAGNIVKNNKGYSFDIFATAATTQISGNNFSGNAQGFNSVVPVNAQLNYWGAASGPTDPVGNPMGSGDKVTSNVTYRPFLASLSMAASAFIATGALTGENFDASLTPAGASLSNYLGTLNDVIILQKLATNPKTIDPGLDVVQYFDVFTSAASGNAMVLKLYASGLTASSQAYYWSAVSNNWILCSNQGIAGTGDFIYVNINPAGAIVPTSPNALELVGTPFVIVKGFAPPPPAFAISAPVQGSETGLTDVGFTWAAVAGANAYEIVISANADLSSPLATQKTAGPAFTFTGDLAAGTYYWRVTALQNDNPIGLSAVGTFKAVAPPAPTQPPITITTQPPATITLTQTQPPAITITQQGDTTVTPAWIWGIIGIGAVLVIVVIVLIVRTRRTS